MSDAEDSARLLHFIASVSGDEHLKVEENLGEGFVRLRVSEAERRQAAHDIRSFEDVVIECLRNARDARARRLFIATARDARSRMLTLIDDGVGIPPAMHEAVFEPRVTSKLDSMVVDRWGVHGRGMALYSVRMNTTQARIALSDVHRGSSVTVLSEGALPERADQSTWPILKRDDEGRTYVVKGPHNIARRVTEFACEHPELDVYLGSPAEIVATLHALAHSTLDPSQLLFVEEPTRLPVWQRLVVAADASGLVSAATTLALPISERTAHRILSGELCAVPTVLARARQSHACMSDPVPPDIYRDRRGLRIHDSDLARFKRDLGEVFEFLSQRYYIHLTSEPRVSVSKNGIVVRFDIEKGE